MALFHTFVCVVALLPLGNAVSVDINPKGSMLVRYKENKQGRWLFGSLTCPFDFLPVDQMFPHQMRQSSERPFDHRVLYISGAAKVTQPQLQATHAAKTQRLQAMQVVDELVDLDDVNALELAGKSMAADTAQAFVKLDAWQEDYNKAMVAFLAKCLDGYDHCAWLDGDIFVHRGSPPWVDEAVQRHLQDPDIIIGLPSFVPQKQDHGTDEFSSRYFIYHTDSLHRLLPLTGVPDDTFEALVVSNYPKVKKWKHSFFQTGHPSGSWVIHPPDKKMDLAHILEACQPGSQVNALIAIVERGSEHGDLASNWRNPDDEENMDAKSWLSHMRQHCGGHPFVASLLEKLSVPAPSSHGASLVRKHSGQAVNSFLK